MYGLQLFIAEGLLGYLLQCSGFICGISAVAKRRLRLIPFLIASIILAIATYLIRTLGRFNFGVHTMLILFIVNLICVLMVRIEVRYSILGSLLVTLLILVGETLNYGLLMIFLNPAEITLKMAEPLFKAWAAVPGNLMLGIVVAAAYILRVKKGKKADGKAG